MRIEIIKQIDAETRETWAFNMFDLNAVFVVWRKEVKPTGKRKWVTECYWDKYGSHERSMVSEPVLPEIIRSEAITEIIKHVKVNTWSEWKAH